MGGYSKHSNGNGSNGHGPKKNGHGPAAGAAATAANGKEGKRVRFEVVDAPER